MPLHVDYRPQTLEELFGNEHVKESLIEVLKRKDPPHSYLFVGQPGCGKTTMARIIKNMLKIGNSNFYEYNAANTRGIDTIREITENTRYLGMGENPKKLYLMDECFAEGTLVNTIDSQIRIENLKIGEKVRNLVGIGTVKNIFTNLVSLDHVCKVSFFGGKSVFCSTDHLFFTEIGWVRACDLMGHFCGDIMNDISSPRKEKTNAQVWFLQRDGRKSLPNLFKGFFSWEKLARTFKEKNLFKILWKQIAKSKPRIYGKTFQPHNSREKIKKPKNEICNEPPSCTKIETMFYRKNEKIKRPSIREDLQRKGQKHQKNEGDFKHFCWGSWWEWVLNSSTEIISNIFRVACRSSSEFGGKISWIPNQLQSRYREPELKISHRSRWKIAQNKNYEGKRYKENEKTERLGVGSVEIYQQGNNDESFRGVIEDHERNQGYVVFYDLEVDNHPSYYANGILVHNCHKWTNDAMNAALKLLEEPPDHCYFILCSAEIETIKPTIKNAIKRRCHEYELSALKPNETIQLLKTILRKEGIDSANRIEVLKKIATSCEGRAGVALKLLDQVLEIQDQTKAVKIIEKAIVTETTVIELCRLLNEKSGKDAKWPKIQKAIKDLKESNEAESVRYAVLGYFNSVLLSGGWSMKTAKLITYFADSFMYSGWAGFTAACFFINFGENENDIAH